MSIIQSNSEPCRPLDAMMLLSAVERKKIYVIFQAKPDIYFPSLLLTGLDSHTFINALIMGSFFLNLQIC